MRTQACYDRKFELGRDFVPCTYPQVPMFTHSEVIVLTNTQTHKPTNKQTPLKTSNALHYTTMLGNHGLTVISHIFITMHTRSTSYNRCDTATVTTTRQMRYNGQSSAHSKVAHQRHLFPTLMVPPSGNIQRDVSDANYGHVCGSLTVTRNCQPTVAELIAGLIQTTSDAWMLYTDNYTSVEIMHSTVIVCSHRRHGQDKTVSNFQLFSLKYIEDYWKPGNWKLRRDKTKLSCLVCSCVHTTDTDKTVLSCPCRRCEQAITAHLHKTTIQQRCSGTFKNIHVFLVQQTTPCLKKTVQNCFCQNFVKFPSILTIFGRKVVKRLNARYTHFPPHLIRITTLPC